MSSPQSNDRSAAPETYAESPLAVDAGALDAVLRATLESGEGDDRVTADEVEALRAVARGRGDGPLVFDPVAVELVEAIILVNYGHLKRPPEVWRAVAVKIATLLFESPTSRARLENLWSRLLESHGPTGAHA
jgi:hypothetical protein